MDEKKAKNALKELYRIYAEQIGVEVEVYITEK